MIPLLIKKGLTIKRMGGVLSENLQNQKMIPLNALFVHETENGVYLFPSSSVEDVGCDGDYWYETPAEADEVAKLKYDISQTDWILIADPLPDCQQDFIRPVRVVGRNIGKPEFGKLEELKDGSWVPLKGQKNE